MKVTTKSFESNGTIGNLRICEERPDESLRPEREQKTAFVMETSIKRAVKFRQICRECLSTICYSGISRQPSGRSLNGATATVSCHGARMNPRPAVTSTESMTTQLGSRATQIWRGSITGTMGQLRPGMTRSYTTTSSRSSRFCFLTDVRCMFLHEINK
jgi:hypothetical protein